MNVDRLYQAIKDCNAAAIPFRRMAIVLAASVNETDVTFGVPRDPSLPYPPTCFTARQILRAEKGRSQSSPLPASWTSDPELMTWAANHGFIDGAGSTFWLRSGVTALDKVTEPNTALAMLFESLIDQRKNRAMEIFSIGPTQMYLYYAGFSAGSRTSIKGRFDTIDELFRFYMSRSIADNFNGSWYDYLPTTRTDYPTPGCPAAQRESYLTAVQTGNVDWSTSGWHQYSADFGMAVDSIWALAQKENYPNIG